MWYTRQEQGLRIALVSSASTFSGAVAGPIAYAISLMDGMRGLASWQWIFIVEGLPTVILGIFAWWIIPGSPATSSWLNCEERAILLKRLKRAHVEIDGKVFDKAQFIEAIKDYKTYMYIFLFLGFIVPTSAVSQLMPTIVKDLGFSASSTMLLTAPPYIFALLVKMAMAWNSDRTMQRSYHIVASILLSMAGFIMQAAATATIPRYIGINLAFAGAISSLPIALSWSNNNMVGATKAPTVVALIIMVGSLGGIVGSQLYKPYEAPRYIPSNLTNIGFLAFSLAISLLLRHQLKKENNKMDCRELRLDEDMSIMSSASNDFRFVL
ncbi:hypothetical protein DSO57_1011213 [Entomophthora muscae]|uniref:Uncharacterized protein n=1 Tax=Entomophthora muscae TaxID=34485 RepID=A0ACC2RL62_9FUNG|nr:hypothetical protein DSO57_1011213 [Entomophthora muscae]